MSNLILWNSLNANHAPLRPVGPHQLATWLISHGYTVKVIDFCHLLSTNELVELTSKHIDSSTIAVGCSTTFWNKINYTALIRMGEHKFSEPPWVQNARDKIQSKYKNIKWLLGGANSMATKLKYDWTIMHGHAEDELLKFMDEHSNISTQRQLFDIKNLDSAYKDDLSIDSSEVLSLELSRGCQFKCKFCRYPLLGKKKNTYIRDFSLIEKELIENYEKFGTTRYSFMDDTVNESDEKITAMAEIAQRLPFKLEWVGYNRLDLIGSKPHTIELLKQSGLKSAFFGIESFHPSASKIIGKGWNGVHGKNFLLELKERWGSDANFFLSFIVGLTGESSEHLDETHQWCIDNNMPDWTFNGLSISRKASAAWNSEFDTNYRMYGYQFPYEDDDRHWVNNMWNYDSAREKAFSLSMDARQHLTVAGYLLAELACVGYSFDELMHTKKLDLDWPTFDQKTKTLVKKYYESQIKQ